MVRTTTAAALAAAFGIALAPAPAAAQDLTDAQIAAVVVAANAADSANGKLALEKAANGKVKAFARQMMEAHTAVNRQAVELVTELGVTPAPSATSRGIAEGQAAERQELSTLSGAAFDEAFIANEVAYHEAVIAAVDDVLLPSAENARLAEMLRDVRPALVAHLEQAKQIRDSLADGMATGTETHGERKDRAGY